MRHRFGVIAVSAGAILASGVGCAKPKECKRVIDTVNPALASIEAVYDGGAPTPATFEDVTRRYRQLADDLTTLRTTYPRLTKAVRDYTALCDRTARATKAIAKAMKQKKARTKKRELDRQRRELERIRGQEKLLVSRLNSACRP